MLFAQSRSSSLVMQAPCDLVAIFWVRLLPAFCRDKLASTSKDKSLSIIDPRAKKIVAAVTCHEGPKATKCCWLDGFAGAPGHVLTTGFSKTNERELHLWDIKNFTKP